MSGYKFIKPAYNPWRTKLKTLQKLGLAAVLATSMSTAFAGGMGGGTPPPAEDVRFTFSTDLSGAQSGVNNTPAGSGDQSTGDMTIEFANDLSSATYTVNSNIPTLFMAHLHCAPAGLNGQPAVTFSTGPGSEVEQLQNTGTVTTTITNADIDRGNPVPGNNCSSRIVNIAALLKATLDGEIYINLHAAPMTDSIRGQFFAPIPEGG